MKQIFCIDIDLGGLHYSFKLNLDNKGRQNT